MASITKVLQMAHERLGVTFTLCGGRLLYGSYEGFPLLIDGMTTNLTGPLQIMLWAEGGQPLSDLALPDEKPFRRMTGANTICLLLNVTDSDEACVDTLLSGIAEHVALLQESGCTGCDERGNTGDLVLYRIKNQYHLLTEASAEIVRDELHTAKIAFDTTGEQYAAGTVGALAGGLLGSLAVLLAARLGALADATDLLSFTLILVGFCIVSGYRNQFAGKKLSPVSAVLCGILSALFAYGTFRLNLAIDIHSEAKEIPVFTALLQGRSIMAAAEGGLSDYYAEMILMAGSSLLSAFGMIFYTLFEQNDRFTLRLVN